MAVPPVGLLMGACPCRTDEMDEQFWRHAMVRIVSKACATGATFPKTANAAPM